MKKDVFLKEYRNFPHGVWNFDLKVGLDECRYMTSDCTDWMNDIIRKKLLNLRK